MVTPTPMEAGASSSKSADLTESSKRWQEIIATVTRGVYGPARVTYMSGDNTFLWSGNWRPGRRESMDKRIAKEDPVAATCSPMVNMVMGVLVAANGNFSARLGGRSMWKALHAKSDEGGYAEYVDPMFPGRRKPKLIRWSKMLALEKEMSLVSVVRLANPGKRWCHHVVFILRCGDDALRLSEPVTGTSCGGLWCLDASGWFRRRKRRGREVRQFSAGPIRFYPAEERHPKTRAEIWRVADPQEDGRIPGPYAGNAPPQLSTTLKPFGQVADSELSRWQKLRLAVGLKVRV